MAVFFGFRASTFVHFELILRKASDSSLFLGSGSLAFSFLQVSTALGCFRLPISITQYERPSTLMFLTLTVRVHLVTTPSFIGLEVVEVLEAVELSVVVVEVVVVFVVVVLLVVVDGVS